MEGRGGKTIFQALSASGLFIGKILSFTDSVSPSIKWDCETQMTLHVLCKFYTFLVPSAKLYIL